MATTEGDYYELLGIGKDASEAEVKKAFRGLARQLHPDVSEEPDAEARFKQVVEAYEVLSNAETRELYDRYGHAGLRSGGFQPGHFDFTNLSDIFSAFFGDDLFAGAGRRAARGSDVAAEVEIDLEEAARGATRAVPFRIAVVCSRCGGNGAEPGSQVTTCPTCGGQGRLQQVSRSVFGEFVRSQTCPRCSGAGQVVEHPCEGCAGSGRIVEERSLDVQIPAGIHDGQRIRISGEGHSGSVGGRAGDAYVLVRVRRDERFVREGNDIFSTVDLTMTQAALGTTLSVATLDGDAELEFGPGTQPGETRVLRGRGMPILQGFGRGDHRVLVNVLVPRHLNEEQRALLRDFELRASDANYRPDEGFFDKLKSAFR
ncbi:MAG: molecular chaperone DnaJ [Gaiellaceae bacterium]|jgi:molecular chaperone DnaJ|nr:molecular chaperone DnaJ [Gaiellaceae bacterium]